ncbi:hypothetical protein MHYP_G00333890 [Metynnis hypsauchen]
MGRSARHSQELISYTPLLATQHVFRMISLLTISSSMVTFGQLNMSNPCSSLLEVLGLTVGIGAWFCSLAATIMPSWQSLSTELLSAESYEVGLWETCVVQEGGGHGVP